MLWHAKKHSSPVISIAAARNLDASQRSQRRLDPVHRAVYPGLLLEALWQLQAWSPSETVQKKHLRLRLVTRPFWSPYLSCDGLRQ